MAPKERKLRDIGGYAAAGLAPIRWRMETSRSRYRRLPSHRQRRERQRGIRQLRRDAFSYPTDAESLVTSLIIHLMTWFYMGAASIVLMLLLSLLGERILREKPLFSISLCIAAALMCMALSNFVVTILKIQFAYSELVSRVYSRRGNDPQKWWARVWDAFLLFLARPSNLEGLVSIFVGMVGYAIGHELIWRDS